MTKVTLSAERPLPHMRAPSDEPKLPYGELIREPSMAAAPRMKAQCHDCAFHPKGSPERSNFPVWAKVLEGCDSGQPFFCHQGMPMDGDQYKPELAPNGAPLGAHVCAGWLETRQRMLDTQRRDLDDSMRAIPVEAPQTFVVALLATVVSAQ